MTLGERIKQLRLVTNLSQPALAELVGIEQSYLSKLENDKSIPSNEIFRSLLKAFNLTLSDFLASFDSSTDRARLTQIADIEHWFKAREHHSMKKLRRYLSLCSAIIVIAITVFYVGFSKKLFSEIRYEYESPGVVLPGEPKNVFNDWRRLINNMAENANELMNQTRLAMQRRHNEEIIVTDENYGAHFETDVIGGSRYYRLNKELIVARPVNAWLEIIGVLLFTSGMMGFMLERRFFKH